MEIDLRFRPIPDLTLSLLGTYTDVELLETIAGAGVAGEKLPYTPKLSATAAVDYEFAIGNTKRAFLGADIAWLDERNTNFPSLGVLAQELESYYTANARVGLELDPYTISLVVRNLFDDDTITDRFLQITSTTINNMPNALTLFRNPPRMISLEATYKFGK